MTVKFLFSDLAYFSGSIHICDIFFYDIFFYVLGDPMPIMR